MDELTPKALSEAANISAAYAWQIVNKTRPPSRPLAIKIWRATGHKFGPIANLSNAEIEMLASLDAKAAA